MKFGQAVMHTFLLHSTKVCPNCGARQYPTRKSQQRSIMLSLTAFLFFLFIVEAFEVRLVYSLIFAGFILFVTAVINPLFIQLSNEEESMW
ncbi:TIGR04104 family putative zinc finger protein [Halobacillus litoralis]|uniref:TIGR04104 family putative zinc finger protein n=1 Tax=Halobacillus litoralis TaxID=45668 RepID=UPI0021F60192|nr:TIGR04104 family putative zinc finger protein [Halobacillus litoralis]